MWSGLGPWATSRPLLPLTVRDPAASSNSLGILPDLRVLPEAHSSFPKVFLAILLGSTTDLVPSSWSPRGSSPAWLKEYCLGKVFGWVPSTLSSISSVGCVLASSWDLCHSNYNNHTPWRLLKLYRQTNTQKGILQEGQVLSESPLPPDLQASCPQLPSENYLASFNYFYNHTETGHPE